jgi:myo-inositol 2-dehydrogenase/D-chiro-inositol 1-dehydrogenase/scyllo-inositol 2-dehydrogenase (NAD+)
MKGTKIGVAVVGTGRAGMIHARIFASGLKGAALTALVDPVPEALAAACSELEVERGYNDYRQALDDPAVQAIVVVTPTVLHRRIVIDAAAAGKHVLCEKPMAMDAAECQDMIEACERGNVKLQIGFMRRFDRGFREAKRAVAEGRIGEVVLIKSLTRGPSIPQAWMYDIAKSSGPLAEVNSHDIDTVRWFSGSDITEVYAIAGNYRCPQARESFPDFYDNVLMSARLANGMQASVDGAVSVGYAYDARLEVLGTKGMLSVGGLADTSVMVCAPGVGISSQAVTSWRSLFAEAYRAEDRSFIDCILNDSPPEVTGYDGLQAVRVVNAGNRSIVQKRPVTLDTPD